MLGSVATLSMESGPAIKPTARGRIGAPRGKMPVTKTGGGTREKLSMISPFANTGSQLDDHRRSLQGLAAHRFPAGAGVTANAGARRSSRFRITWSCIIANR